MPVRTARAGAQFVDPLTGVERRTGLEGSINLRAGKQHLYVSGPVPDAPSVVRARFGCLRLPLMPQTASRRKSPRLPGGKRQLAVRIKSAGQRHRGLNE